jgi:predicted phosphodiesterase
MADARMLLRRLWPWVAALLLASAGAWLALLAAGRGTYQLGPFRVELFARPGSGLTEVALPPLGQIRADTHAVPLRLTATLDLVDPDRLNQTVEAVGVQGLVEQVEHRGLDATRSHGIRAAVVALAGVAVAGLLFRRRIDLGRTAVSGLVLVGLATAGTWFGYRADAFVEPVYTGSLRLAPDLIGPIQQATRRIEVFRDELGRLVRGTVEAYGAVTAGPGPSEDATVVLHISDIHSSPLGMDFAQQLAATFGADLVVDTGDLTSFGSRLETAILERIPQFGVPYLFVRGNHDSTNIGVQVEAQTNAETLESETATAAGLTLFGAAHPLFTPGRRLSDEEIADTVAATRTDIADRVASLDPFPDIVLLHDDRMAVELAGRVPLVLSGHFHRFDADVQEGTFFLQTASAGGGGLDTFVDVEPLPLAAEVVYLDGSPPRLVAVDRVALEPETRQLLVERQLAQTIRREVGEPAPAPSSPGLSPEAETAP